MLSSTRMKVAFVGGINANLDASRGIGTHTKSLLEEFKKIEQRDLEVVDDPRKADITHYTKFSPFFVSLPFFKPSKKIILTIHDLIPLIYPEHYPSGIKGIISFAVNRFLIWKNVDAIITISETSKKDICRFLGVNPEKVLVTYLAPKKIFRKLNNASYPGLPKKFALYVGDINYNKNIPNLVKACEIANIPLVIAGKQAKEIENMNLKHPELSHLLGVDFSNTIRLGFVSDENLVEIYNLATVFIQPSLYEGFGLPAVEAIACETPIAVTRSQCMVEILGDNFYFCDQNDVDSMANAISNPNRNKKLLQDYSWKKTTQQTLEVYLNV